MTAPRPAPLAAVPNPTGSSPARPLVEDIKPVPTKERAPLGVVQLALDEGQRIEAVGVVYGLTHELSGEGWKARIFLDQYSQRIKVLGYEGSNLGGLIAKVRWLSEANGFDKSIFMASADDWAEFLRYGYVLEAVIKYYHRGEDAFVMSKFRSQERLTSHPLMEEILLIERIMDEVRPGRSTPLPEGYSVRLARREDVPELLHLYETIFETYPSPLIYESYLQTVFAKDSLFAVCLREGRIVAAASAELHHDDKAAELTDCATRKEARGLGLMSHLLELLERELERREYVCAYTMARARSYGMNAVFRRLGYDFCGRLVNNCDIYGAYEDMNIWVRRLGKKEPLR